MKTPSDTDKKKRIFYAATRKEWRAWLAAHYESESDVWFVFPEKSAGEPGVSYNDAVEEALCFGWIDSTAGRLDETHGIRRFSPRRPGAAYSRPNIERLLWLDARGMLMPSVKESVAELLRTPYVFPEDILAAIRADAAAWEHYEKFTEPYRRIRVAYIDAARDRPAEFDKRLKNFLAKTRAGKRIVGYGGIEKYYN